MRQAPDRCSVEGDRLVDYLTFRYGLLTDKYAVERQQGGDWIKAGNRRFRPMDFLIEEICLPVAEALHLLGEVWKLQLAKVRSRRRQIPRREWWSRFISRRSEITRTAPERSDTCAHSEGPSERRYVKFLLDHAKAGDVGALQELQGQVPPAATGGVLRSIPYLAHEGPRAFAAGLRYDVDMSARVVYQSEQGPILMDDGCALHVLTESDSALRAAAEIVSKCGVDGLPLVGILVPTAQAEVKRLERHPAIEEPGTMEVSDVVLPHTPSPTPLASSPIAYEEQASEARKPIPAPPPGGYNR